MNAKPTAYSILEHKHSNGDARNRTEGNIGEKPLTCHRQNETEASEKYNKNKGDVNERNRGRDSNPQRLYDTLISGTSLFNS